jgi:outer membrane protein OmpA-like peptidoglycan-associated protein
MRLLPVLLASALFAAAACSRSQAPTAVPSGETTPAVATTPAVDAQDAAAPVVVPNLLSFANGTIMPVPFDDLLVTAPILMIDGSSIQNWVGDGKPQSFVFELPEEATIRTLEFDDDTSGMGGVDAGVKDLTVEVSATSAKEGFQPIFSGSLAKGVNGQRFDIAKPVAGRWLRTNFTSNHGSSEFYSLAEIRAFGDAPAPALVTGASGSYTTVWGTWHITQAGTTIDGCFQPAGLSSSPATFSGGMEGNIARIRYIETDDAGAPRDPKAMLLVFARDGQRFFTAAADGESLSDYGAVKRESSEPATCAGRTADTVSSVMADTLANDGRVTVYGINFDFNSATLRPESSVVLEQVAGLLRDKPELVISIEGHTDDVGGDAYNASLSGKRANAVRDWLVAAGIDGARLEAVGKGAGSPVASNGNDVGRAQNRRVELAKR